MLYSIKMRSSLGGVHGEGGRHISGAERIVPEDDVERNVISMLRRARRHERGAADFIQVRVEEVPDRKIHYCGLLPLYERVSHTKEEGRHFAIEELIRAGVTEKAAQAGMAYLTALTDSMRGAMVVDAVSGKRLDRLGSRGVRCSNMDCENTALYESRMAARGLSGEHPREALVLASKVASAAETVAELCWSDDPQYVTGYVGSPRYGYGRITVLKDKGDPVGGRIFFVRPGTDVDAYEDYMQNQPVLVRIHHEN